MITRMASLAILSLAGPAAMADKDVASKTVIGPSNIYLYDGSHALKAGDGEEGVRLTLLGLKTASSPREEKIAHANLCAGFLLVAQYETALEHCNWVIERDPDHWRTYNNRALVYLRMGRLEESDADIRKGQALNPKSENLKEVKGMYLDEVDPVQEQITIDERRDIETPEGEEDD